MSYADKTFISHQPSRVGAGRLSTQGRNGCQDIETDCPHWDEMAVKTLKDSLTIFVHPPEPSEVHRSLSAHWYVESRSRLHAFNMASIGKFHTPTTLKAHSSKAKHARNKRPARRESQQKTTIQSCQYLSSNPSDCRATLLLGEIFDFRKYVTCLVCLFFCFFVFFVFLSFRWIQPAVWELSSPFFFYA